MPPRRRGFCRATRAVPAVAIALACSGGGDGAGGTDITAPPGGSSSPPPTGTVLGVWSGTTSQGLPFSLYVDASGIVLAVVGTSVQGATCTNAVTSVLSREPPSQPIAVTSGAFSISTSGSSGSLAVSGTLSTSGTGTGTLTVNDTKCTGTLNGSWTATRATGPSVALGGTWNGSFASSLVSRVSGVLTIVQNGATLSGSFNIPSNGATGTIAGTVSGRMASFTFTQTTPGCSGLFTGHAVALENPEVLVYYYTGSDCLGAHTGGNGSATR